MPAERRASAPAKERGFLVLGGINASNRGMRKFVKILGPHALAYNSEFSSDPPNPSRYEQQGRFLKRQLDHDRKPVILADQLGLQSLGMLTDAEKAKEDGVFNNRENGERTTVIVTTPIGLFHGPLERAAFIINSVQLLTSPMVKGINALTAFPPNPKIVTDAQLDPYLGKWQQSHATVREIDVPNQSFQERTRPEKIAEKLTSNDIRIAYAVANGNGRDVRRAIKERGKIAQQYVQDIFEGKDTNDSTTEDKIDQNSLKTAWPVLKRLILGTSKKDIQYLAEQGNEVVLVQFKRDRVASLKQSVRLRDKLARKGINIDVVVFNGFGNTGLALDHWAYADTVNGLLDEKEEAA